MILVPYFFTFELLFICIYPQYIPIFCLQLKHFSMQFLHKKLKFTASGIISVDFTLLCLVRKKCYTKFMMNTNLINFWILMFVYRIFVEKQFCFISMFPLLYSKTCIQIAVVAGMYVRLSYSTLIILWK